MNLRRDKLHSSFASNFNLRPYALARFSGLLKAAVGCAAVRTLTVAGQEGNVVVLAVKPGLTAAQCAHPLADQRCGARQMEEELRRSLLAVAPAGSCMAAALSAADDLRVDDAPTLPAE